jgi:CDP-glucose 4,6-dehydratase
MFRGFYQGKNVLVTGHTGFKGGWLSLWLKSLGAKVAGLSLAPSTNPNLHEIIQPGTFTEEIIGDIRDLDFAQKTVQSIKPEVIFHLAAQPIVRRSYDEPLETLETNAMGTAHLLEAVRRAGLNCICVVVTSDKCYENKEWEFAYRENDPMGGHDVYSMSKGVAELIAQSWNKSFFLPNPKLGHVVTARAGNVIGGGDYAVDRIIPDSVRALLEKKPILVRNPIAVRPWQHVLECLSGYLWLAARLSAESKGSRLASPFNFGPEPSARQPVRRLVEEILKVWPGEWTDGSNPNTVHEATLLSLSIEKAGALLKWSPAWDFSQAIHKTMDWYYRRHVTKKEDMADFSRLQIEEYAQSARAKNLEWASE